MRDANKWVLAAIAAAALGGCSKPANDADNVIITDINNADPKDIEAVPPDESSGAPEDELTNDGDANGADQNATDNDGN
ncbi:MAG TPA: hypothetical protein VJM15_01820 [Sphingomicrobium sp.]|nr:hypothetical protein [Sphingomicrobium sp.]